jgi:hypothetical protein
MPMQFLLYYKHLAGINNPLWMHISMFCNLARCIIQHSKYYQGDGSTVAEKDFGKVVAGPYNSYWPYRTYKSYALPVSNNWKRLKNSLDYGFILL